MSQLQTRIATDTWIIATWDEYIQAIEAPAYEKAKGYYYNGQMRIEAMPVGPDHANDNEIVYFAITLLCTIKGIPLNGLISCSYRKVGVRECQPDISYYVGEQANSAPQGSSVVDLNNNPLPDLAIEIANTSLSDDLGQKRLLYEDMEVPEYWVVDVQKLQIIAFEISNSGSRRITQSQVLPGLTIAVLEEALKLSRQMDQSQVGNWLLSQFQQ